MLKKFYDQWTETEILDYISTHDVLVLFELPQPPKRDAKLHIHGKLEEGQEDDLHFSIVEEFGGESMSEELCEWINYFAQWWYERQVGPKRIRVINI